MSPSPSPRQVFAVDVEEPEEEPSLERKLQEAQKIVAGDVPLISDAPDTIVHLPRGIFTTKWEADAEVRELTGFDEEALARFKEPEDFFNGVVVYGTARVGSIDLRDLPFAERNATMARLLIGEREQLFLHVIRVTYGDEKEITHTCPFCKTQADTTLLLSEDIPISEMKDPHTLLRTMQTGRGHSVSYRLATGADQMTVWSRKGANAAEQNTIMLSECLLQVDGEPIVDPLGFARGLSMGNRQKLLEELVGNQPSPDLNLKLPCISCGEEMSLPLTLRDLFRY